MAALALKAVALGADKIPDRVFESIPGGYFRPKDRTPKEKEKRLNRERRERRSDDRRSDSDRRARSEGRTRNERTPSDDDRSNGDYYSEDDRGYQRRRRSQRRSTNRSDWSGRSYHSARSRQAARSPSPVAEEGGDNYDDKPREPPMSGSERNDRYPGITENTAIAPPPLQDFSFDRGYSPRQTSPQRLSYNPVEYARRPSTQRSGSRDEYYSGHPPDPGFDAANPYARTTIPDRTSMSSTPDRYRPPAYDPVFPHQPSMSQPPPQQSHVLPPQSQSQTYNPAQSQPVPYSPPTTVAPYNPADYAPSPRQEPAQPWSRAAFSPAPTTSNQVGPYTGPESPEHGQIATYEPPTMSPSPPQHTQMMPPPQHAQTMPPPQPRNMMAGGPPMQASPVGPPPASYYDYSGMVPRHRSSSHSRSHRERRNRRYSEASRGSGRSGSSIRAKFEEYRKDPEKREMGVSALGALAGGLAGHEMGRGGFGTILGAALGSFGAHEYDKKRERKKRYMNYEDGYESY